jgi:hypothetical protein
MAGLVTHCVMQPGWLGKQILNTRQVAGPRSAVKWLQVAWWRLKRFLSNTPSAGFLTGGAAFQPAVACCNTAGIDLSEPPAAPMATMRCTTSERQVEPVAVAAVEPGGCSSGPGRSCSKREDACTAVCQGFASGGNGSSDVDCDRGDPTTRGGSGWWIGTWATAALELLCLRRAFVV